MNSVASSLETRAIPKVKLRFYWPIEKILREVGKAYADLGDVLELTGLPQKVFCSRNPDHVDAILRHPEVGMTKYPRLLPRVKWVMGNGGYILRGGTEWRERRAHVQPAFKPPCLARYAHLVPEITERRIQSWREHAEHGAAFDVFDALQSIITDVDLQMFLSTVAPEDVLERVKQQTHFVEAHLVEVPPLWLPTPQNLRFRRDATALREFMGELVRERKNNPAGKADLLSALLEARDPRTGQPWPEDDIVGEIFSVFFGASVMSVTLSWALSLIARHPDVQEKLAAELDAVLQGRTPGVEDLEQLPYTHMVLKETLRLYPASWGYPRHCEQGMEVDGYRIPPDSIVIPMAYHVHRHPAHWVSPESFNPERFDAETSGRTHRFAYVPFGAGARTCLGANLAPMVLRLVIATICQRFRLEAAPRFAGDPAARFAFEIQPQDAVLMKVIRR